MIFQGAGNRYWKPNLNDPSQAVGASVSGIADWYGQPIGSFGAGNATGAGVGSVGSTGAVGSTGSAGVTGPGGNLNFSSIVGGGSGAGGTGGIAQITQLVNEIDQAAQQAANRGRIPGGAGLEGQSSANIASALAGEVDRSTLNLLGQQAAERGAMSGSPMGDSNNAAYLRAVYDTSANRQNIGQNWLSAATARNPAAPIYSAGNQVLTAAQVQDAILARENMANQLRIAQMRGSYGGGGGGYRGGTAPGISSSATNWANPIMSEPAPGWNFPPGYSSIPVGGSSVGNTGFNDYFTGNGGGQPINFGTPEIPVNPGVAVQPYQSPFSTNWEDMIFGADDFNSDWSDVEDWFYGGP